VLLLASHVAQAQQQPNAEMFATGFTPDPVRLAGRTGGTQPLNARAPGCRGFVGTRADQTLDLSTRFGFLRLFVVAPAGVTLAVRGPDGRWRCSGRPLLGAPREQGAFTPGRYEVWIGSVRQNLQVPYELHVTEFHSVTPATGRGADEPMPIGGGAEIGLAVHADHGRFGPRRLRRGFLPDPRENEGRAGGDIDLALLGGNCRGRVASEPSHVLTLRDQLDYFRIQIVNASVPMTLLVRTPEGAWMCSAPDSGDPFVERDSWRAGVYRIWVGTRQAVTGAGYHIRYSETRPPRQH
jgi:hypothetical protein